MVWKIYLVEIVIADTRLKIIAENENWNTHKLICNIVISLLSQKLFQRKWSVLHIIALYLYLLKKIIAVKWNQGFSDFVSRTNVGKPNLLNNNSVLRKSQSIYDKISENILFFRLLYNILSHFYILNLWFKTLSETWF